MRVVCFTMVKALGSMVDIRSLNGHFCLQISTCIAAGVHRAENTAILAYFRAQKSVFGGLIVLLHLRLSLTLYLCGVARVRHLGSLSSGITGLKIAFGISHVPCRVISLMGTGLRKVTYLLHSLYRNHFNTN